MTNNTSGNMTEANDSNIAVKRQMMEEFAKDFMNRKPNPTFYSVNPQLIVLSKKTICAKVKISGWSNGRYLFIDRERQESYFQVTIEEHGCEDCHLCQEKLKLLGWKTRYTFYNIDGRRSLYQKLPGVPDNLSVESLRKFLGLGIVALIS